ncbi:LOW QUALITY PROTEIN: ubiquilin-1-like [Pterocles gutturalis]
MSKSKGAAETCQPDVTMDSSNIIKVMVKTLKQKEQFGAQGSTIQEFKEEVAKRFKTAPDLLVLVFAGKILKDQDTLGQHGVHSGVSIHVVIRSQKRPPDSVADEGRATTPVQPPRPSNSSLFCLGLGADLQNPCLVQHDLQELLTSSQAIVAQTMEDVMSWVLSAGLDLNTINNNAFLLGFLLGVTGTHLLGLDSTDMLDLGRIQGEEEEEEGDASMHSLLSEMVPSNFMQSIFDNADVADLIMSNPRMQQLAEENPEIDYFLTNPDRIREMLQASSSPAILQEKIRNNDVAMNNLESIPGGHRALEQHYREIEEHIWDAVQAQLGNDPFARLDSDQPLSGARLPARTENRRPLHPWAPQSTEPAMTMTGTSRLASSSAGGSFTSLSVGPKAGAVFPSSEEVQSMVQQLTGDAELMHNLGSALAAPNSPAQRLLNSARCYSPPPDQWAQQLPPEMENAEISSLLRNPRAQQALLQIHLGLETLSTEAPEFLVGLEDSAVELDLESMDASPQSSEPEHDAVLVSDGGRSRRQMEQLVAMGDRSANLQALLDAEGEVNAAAEILAKASSPKKIP